MSTPEAKNAVTKYLLDNFEWSIKDQLDIEVIERRVELSLSNSSLKEKKVRVFYRHYKQKNPRGVVVLFHGIGSCSAMYGPLANRLRKPPLNFDVISFDQFGHGRTTQLWNVHDNSQILGEPKEQPHPDCYIPDHKIMTELSWEFLREVILVLHKDRLDGKPIFLDAQSLGGAVVLSMLMNPPKNSDVFQRIAGVILEAPAIDIIGLPSTVAIGILRGVSALLPSLPTPSVPKFEHISRIPEMVKLRSTHPECFTSYGIPLATGREVISLFDNVKNQLEKDGCDFPMLLLHGTEDRVVNIAGSKRLFQLNKNQDKTYKEYEGAFHSLTLDSCSKEVHDDIYQWLSKHVN